MKLVLLFASFAILSTFAEPRFGKPAGLIPGAVPANISTFYGRNVQITTQEASETIIFQNEVNSSIILASSNYFDVEQWTTVVPGLYASLDSGLTWKESFFPQKKRSISGKNKRLPRLHPKWRTGKLAREEEDPDAGSIGDPTMEWNSEGTVAYSATLANCEEGCDMWFWKSKDLGKTWIGPVQIDESSMCDKPMLHVDKSSSSPYKDTIYIIYDDPGNGNVQLSGYSRDGGQTWKVQAFNYTAGIGGDVTSDVNGKVYYFYPEFQTLTINFMTSSDGGVTFTNSTPIASTNSSFQMQLPAQDQRGALVYTSVDVDISPSSPYSGSVYVSWSDSWPDQNGDHAHLVVAHSRDAGKTWTKVIPHTMSDISSVDRFFQWLSVDPKGNGRVHLSFYDTSNWADRSGVDTYYTYSDDGGVTWATPLRMSSMSSGNVYWDFDQFGDYEGLSVRHNRVMPIWADNRNKVGPVCVWTAILDNDVLENCKNFNVQFDISPAHIKVNQPITFKALVTGNTGALNYEWNFSESASVDCSTAQCSWTFHSTNYTQVSLFASEQRAGGCYRGATAFVQPVA